MRTRRAVACALVLAASARALAQDAFEPNPSLARLTADDAYARTSAESLREAGFHMAVALRLDDTGRVLVAGVQETYGVGDGLPRVARLDAAGRLDPSFGKCGVAEIPGVRGSAYDLLVDASGRILVAGSFHDARAFPWRPDSTATRYAAARLLPDGTLDRAFSGDGLLELDSATGIESLGPFRSAGDDGAMLAVAAKPGPYSGSGVGVVRVAADGTLDSAYGGGFALIGDASVVDFSVDSMGRALVAVASYYREQSSTVRRLDASGSLDLSFWGASSRDYAGDDFAASRFALDGADRIVGLNGPGISRRLPDGAPDLTFAGDGALLSLEAAAFPGGLRAYSHLWSRIRWDPDFDPKDETGLVGVAARADRWVVAKGPSRAGIGVQSIDPADPGAILWTSCRPPEGSGSVVLDLAVTPDGTAAYVLSESWVARVDLTASKPEPLPDLRVRWLGFPRAVNLGGSYRVAAKVRITNASRRDVTAAYGNVGFGVGTYDLPLDGQPNDMNYTRPFRLRARSSVVKRFAWEGGTPRTSLAGERLSIRVACELPDANFDDNVATSLPMTPLYAPR